MRREQSVQEKEKELKELRDKTAILEAEVTRSTIATTMCSVTFQNGATGDVTWGSDTSKKFLVTEDWTGRAKMKENNCKVRGEMSKAMGLTIKKNLGVDWLEQEVILADLKRQGPFEHLKDESLVILIGLAVKEGVPGDDYILCISNSQEE